MINFDDVAATADVSGGMTLFPDQPKEIYTQDYSADKADMMGVVLGPQNPGVDSLTSAVAGGMQEAYLRQIQAQDQIQNLTRRNDIIREIAANRDPSQPFNQNDMAVIEGLTDDELYASDLNTILEKKYSEFYTNLASASEENNIFRETFEQDQEGALDVLDRAQAPMQRSLAARDVLENVKARYDSTSWASWGLDQAKSLIPLYSTLKTRELIATPTASLLSGNNREDQIAQLYSLPPTEFKTTLSKIIDELAEDNIVEALDFASSVIQYSQNDAGWANLGTVADATGLLTEVGTVSKLAKGMASLGKAVTTSPRNIGKIAAAAGMNKTAAIANVTKNITNGDLSGVRSLQRIEEVGDLLPSVFAPQKWMTGGSKYLSAESQARVNEVILNGSDKIKNALQDSARVDRLEPSQIQNAAAEAMDEVLDYFDSNAHKVIDSEVLPASEDALTNTATLSVRFGRQDGSFFKYEETAKRYADKYIGLKTDDYAVRQDTLGGYYIEVRRPLADVGTYRNQKIETTLATPDTYNGRMARAMRSPDYLLSGPNVAARGASVHSAERMSGMIDELTEPLRGKSSKFYDEMDDMFRSTRVSKKIYGSADEFEDAFYKKFNRPPSEDHYSAYYRYIQLGDFDYLIRDADMVKRMTAKGIEDFSYKLVGPDDSTTVSQLGRLVDDLPGYDKSVPYRIRVIENGKETHNVSSATKNWSNTKTLLDKLKNDGYKIIHHADSDTYTFVRDFKRSSVKMKSLNYKPGGHQESRYDFFISQGKFDDRDGMKVLLEDINLATTPTKSQAQEIARVFEEARVKVKNNAPDAQKFIDQNLPISYAEFMKKVNTKAISLDHPIVARTSGQTSSDVIDYKNVYGDAFRNYQSSERNLLQDTSGRYTTQQADTLLDVYQADKGTVFKSQYESILDPMDALSSATKNLIDVRTMEDYRIKSTNDWVQEFGHLLDVHPETLKANPRWYLQNPPYRSKVDIDKAEASRINILALSDQVDSLTSTRNMFKDKALDAIFKTAGEDVRAWTDSNWKSARDVQQFMRRTTSNLKLGMFNPKQLFLQSSQTAAIVAISPRAGLSGMRAVFPLSMMLRTGDQTVINGLANRFAKVAGWDKQDLIQMADTMKRSGWANLGGDLAYLDQIGTKGIKGPFQKVGQTPVGKIASQHQIFFKAGEEFSRQIAWATAWREFKNQNPGKEIDRFAETRILQRAKDLTANMTRDSNASWQRGWASVATQFYGYNARVMEQLWDGGLIGNGKKLTRNEKLRYMTTMSLMYGAPTSAAMVFPFVPAKEVLNQWLVDAGINREENPILDEVVEGSVHAMIESMLGADVDTSTFGPTGISTLYDLLNEDKTWAEAMMGASAGVAGDVAKSLNNLRRAYGYTEGKMNLTVNDVLPVLQSVTSVDSAVKLYTALNTGRYFSKNGTYLTDVNGAEALLQAFVGLPPDLSETFAKTSNMKSVKDARKKALKQYQDWQRKAVMAVQAGDDESYLEYSKRAESMRIGFGLTPQEVNQANRVIWDDTPMTQSVDENMERIQRKYKLYKEEE